jgi:dephospho-CoA kinase
MRKNFLVAITGGIGSGKTTVIKEILNNGYPVINCDEITKKLYKTAKVKRWVKTNFPTCTSGKLFIKVNKKALAELVFKDKKALDRLTDYLTELIFKKAIKSAKKKKGLVFIEVPLLFEKGYQEQFDKVIVVLRDKEERILSVIKRSNLTKEQVVVRIDNQVDYESIDLSKFIVINNDKDIVALKEKVISTLENLKT